LFPKTVIELNVTTSVGNLTCTQPLSPTNHRLGTVPVVHPVTHKPPAIGTTDETVMFGPIGRNPWRPRPDHTATDPSSLLTVITAQSSTVVIESGTEPVTRYVTAPCDAQLRLAALRVLQKLVPDETAVDTDGKDVASVGIACDTDRDIGGGTVNPVFCGVQPRITRVVALTIASATTFKTGRFLTVS
jgi:hypothetical protein